MIYIKTNEEINILREGGKRLAEVVYKVSLLVRPGVTSLELDKYAYGLIKELGDEPAFLGYKPAGHKKPFPATLCTSINDEVVHGVPIDQPIPEGSIISIDCGLKHRGLFTDHAITVPVGKVENKAIQLLEVTKKSLMAGIAQSVIGNTVGDIGFAISKVVNNQYGVIKELAGHGVGRYIHEEPYVPNYGRPGSGQKLLDGMVIAIEPMLVMGSPEIAVAEDGYTIMTSDGGLAAHFEHTVAISEHGPEVLTSGFSF